MESVTVKMSFPLKIASLLILIAISTNIWAQEIGVDYSVTRDTPSWFKPSFLNFEDEIDEAKQSQKKLMVYFGQDGCPYCKRLHEINFNDAAIQETLVNHFESIAINMFGDLEVTWIDGNTYTEKTLAQHLNIQFTPSLLFIDHSGEVILKLSGYQVPDKFMLALKYVIEQPHEISLSDYIQSHRVKKSQATQSLDSVYLSPPYDLASLSSSIVIFVTERDCQTCDEWDRFFSSNNFDPWRNKIQVLRLDRFGKKQNFKNSKLSDSEWAKKNNIAFVPALIFMNPEGEQFRIDGYFRTFHLQSIFDYVSSGAYLQEPEFQRFLHERSNQIRETGQNVQIW